uniref:ShKT domain-containing protein n=1 Tax=Chaetoceros debilis TaxID=122233 RepID=A0A7S3Q3U4_9STRA
MIPLLFFSLVVLLFQDANASCKGLDMDDPNYQFTLFHDNKTLVKCSWLTENDDKLSNRKTTYCPYVELHCPISCNYVCTTKAPIQTPTSRPSSMPSTSPTKLPTISPTKGPTKFPSKAPTNAPTGPCADSSTYEWTNDLGNTVDCAWLTKNSKQSRQRIERWCEEANVSFACPITCETCTISCVDDATYKISLMNKKKDVFCSWISSNGVKEAQRRNMYCDKEGDRCPKSCGFCP